MNSPKLTNALLIALIAINVLFFIGWKVTSMHHRHGQRIAMYMQFRGMHQGRFSGHHYFSNFRGQGCGCGVRERDHNSRWN